MSILNLAQQGVGLMRETSQCEELLKNAKNLKSIRTLAQEHDEVKEEVLNSVAPCKDLLNSLYQRLTLKQRPFITFQPATEDELDGMWQLLGRINPAMTKADTTKAALKSRPQIQDFLDSHCRCRHYMFCVKKCSKEDCPFHQRPRLPPEEFEILHYLPDPQPREERYQPFETLYGKETSEKYRPSLISKATKGHGLPFNPTAQTAKNVLVLVQCDECQKWRTIHAQRKLKPDDRVGVQHLLENIQYSCGSVFADLLAETDEDIWEDICTTKPDMP